MCIDGNYAWLGVDQRLGDALGYSIIYRDLVNSILNQLAEEGGPARNKTASALAALTPWKALSGMRETRSCYAYLSIRAGRGPESTGDDPGNAFIRRSLPASSRLGLERIPNNSAREQLINIHREKLASLRTELEEFIRKNDYQAIQEGFGKEADVWLRAIRMIVGNRNEK